MENQTFLPQSNSHLSPQQSWATSSSPSFLSSSNSTPNHPSPSFSYTPIPIPPNLNIFVPQQYNYGNLPYPIPGHLNTHSPLFLNQIVPQPPPHIISQSIPLSSSNYQNPQTQYQQTHIYPSNIFNGNTNETSTMSLTTHSNQPNQPTQVILKHEPIDSDDDHQEHVDEDEDIIKKLFNSIWKSMFVNQKYFSFKGTLNYPQFRNLFLQKMGSPESNPHLKVYLENYIKSLDCSTSLADDLFTEIYYILRKYITVLKDASYEPATEESIRSRTKKECGNLNKNSTDVLKQWILKNLRDPYPSLDEKRQLAKKSGLSLSQVSNWFINYRRRNLAKLKECESNLGDNDVETSSVQRPF